MSREFSGETAKALAYDLLSDPEEAVRRLCTIYAEETERIRIGFEQVLGGAPRAQRIRGVYPEVRITVRSHSVVDTRLAFGYLARPDTYATTITRPDLFKDYLVQQLDLLIRNYGEPIAVGRSKVPIPLHFAWPEGMHIEGHIPDDLAVVLPDIFDLPDLELMDDSIVNGTHRPATDEALPLALFTGPRVDFSLHRLKHYTGTSCEHFQNFILFTNYQFYVDEFARIARELMAEGGQGWSGFVEPGNLVTQPGAVSKAQPMRLPQMPAYHLLRPDRSGVTLINIGVGPSNAKTITDHVAVLRPHAWLMLGHCAGLRRSQRLGDYALAHGYVREDHVLDADLPTWVPIPPLAEVQVALEQAVAQVTGLEGYELKRIMRTGTVATIDNRNWELRDQREPVERFSQSRAIALDMESATIAANGFRFRVPYGTLLCVSDKPLHGEIKLPGMATAFYERQVKQHLQIGLRAFDILRQMPTERLHSRKLRSFAEVAFQ